MKRNILSFIFFCLIHLLLTTKCVSQNVVFLENFEATGYNWRGTFSNSNGVYVSGNSGMNDIPANSSFYNSFNTSAVLYGSGNAGSGPERVTINLPVVNLNPNLAYCLKVRFASFGINPTVNTAAGVDNQDYLRLSVAYNGSAIYSPEIQVNGSNNITWNYNAPSTIYRTVQGSFSNYAQVVGQEYSTMILELPIGTSQISAEIDLSCNGLGESWLVDDVQLISGCYSPLPIELLYFKGMQEKNLVELSWATATETNNNYFTLFSSNDLTEIFYVDTIQGFGNSNSMIEYKYYDKNPRKYYRLCQTDYDGTTECFDWISVQFSEFIEKKIRIIDINGKHTELKYNQILIFVDESGNYKKIILIK